VGPSVGLSFANSVWSRKDIQREYALTMSQTTHEKLRAVFQSTEFRNSLEPENIEQLKSLANPVKFFSDEMRSRIDSQPVAKTKMNEVLGDEIPSYLGPNG